MVVGMLVSVVAVVMIVKTTQDYRTRRTATGSCAKRIVKHDPVRRQGIHIGCANDGVAIATRIRTLVIRNKQDDIGSVGSHCVQWQQSEQQQADQVVNAAVEFHGQLSLPGRLSGNCVWQLCLAVWG